MLFPKMRFGLGKYGMNLFRNFNHFNFSTRMMVLIKLLFVNMIFQERRTRMQKFYFSQHSCNTDKY